VSAWVLDKRALSGGQGRWDGRHLELLLDQCRRDVQHLARLKHPSVLRLISPLEETRTTLVFISEPVFSSLADILGGGALPPALASERRQVRLSELEVKHGMLQISEALHFLHGDAGLAHRGLCPAHLLITHAGALKLAGFGFAAPLDYKQGAAKGFDYADPSPSPLAAAVQPPLPYVAPELAVAAGAAPRVLASADVFSLATVAFELITRRQLLPVRHSLADYESRVHSLALVDMAGVPHALEGVLRQMLAPAADSRPPVAAFAGCSFFAADVQLRALKFLDTLLQRDAVQRAAFLRDLPAMCDQFDSRVLKNKVRSRVPCHARGTTKPVVHFSSRDLPFCAPHVSMQVLPPLLQELRTAELQASVLPLVLTIVGHQTPQEFQDTTLPALQPLLATASGDTLLLLCRHADRLAAAAPRRVAAELVPAVLVRAMEHGGSSLPLLSSGFWHKKPSRGGCAWSSNVHVMLPVCSLCAGDARCQEEGLRQMACLIQSLDYEGLKRHVLPAAQALCLATTSAAVRVAAFRSLAAAAARTDQPEAEAMLAVAAQVAAVDKSAPTAMCVLGLGEALAKQWGAKLAAERVLPAITPLLVLPALSPAQFGTALRAVRDVLAEVERSRAGQGGGREGADGAAARRDGGRGAPPGDEPVDWLAATSTAPAPSRGAAALRPAGSAARASRPLAAPAPPLGAGDLAASASARGRESSSAWAGSDTMFVSAASPAALPSADPFALSALAGKGVTAQPWSGGGIGGTQQVGMRPAPAAALADPFAGLQVRRPSAQADPPKPAQADPFDTLPLFRTGAPPATSRPPASLI
jgi:SCY1-like protein 2